MGQYKVPQNVESEDKILGPLSLKQFIYAIIGLGYGFLTFAIFQQVILIWIIVGLPPMLFMLALGLYQREDQPLETYVLAVAQYFARPKVRFWQKEPIAEVFKVEPTPPKPQLKRRDPREVRSQLSQLANLVDTRGWETKQPEVQEPDEQPVVDLADRLGAEILQLQPTSPVALPSTENTAGATIAPAMPEINQDDDILDGQNSKAQDLNILIENTAKSVRHEALQKMDSKPAPSTTAMTAAPSGDILKLATEGGDLTVAQIASQAHKQQTLAEGQSVTLSNANTNPTA
jgi:hypothetical protein